ncbi:MAG: response regulator [Fibromonadaceae bacterium]|jgi:PAS domain S-box-containing protein|nr:response regulator [Fibromonadaceae bacterium]
MNRDGLMRELGRFTEASKVGDNNIVLSTEGLSREEAEIVNRLNEITGNFRAAQEYDLMKYKLTGDTLGIALWDMDVISGDPINPNNKFTWSQEFRAMLGFSDEADFPNVLQSWSNRLHPEDKERTLRALTAHINDHSGKTPYDVEYRLMLKDGHYRYFRAFGTSQRDSAGTPLRVAGALEDITEKTQVEEGLERSARIVKAINKSIEVFCLQEEKTFDEVMASGILPVAETVGFDRVCVFRFKDAKENLPEVRFLWDRSPSNTAGTDKSIIDISSKLFNEERISTLYKGNFINKRTCDMPEDERNFFNSLGIKTIFLGPIFTQGNFWGVVFLQDNIGNVYFFDNSVDVGLLQSSAHVFASTIIKEDMRRNVENALSESHKTLETLEHREKMISTLNRAAVKFLSQTEDTFEETMTAGVRLIAEMVDLDRFSLWCNFTMPDGLHASQIYRWDKEAGGTTTPTTGLEDVSYAKLAPRWEKLFAADETINSPAHLLPEAAVLKSFGVVSAYITPLFINNMFWGFALFEDRHNERYFDEESTEMMHSAAFLCVNTIIMNEKTQSIVKTLEALKNREKVLAYQLDQQKLVSEISKNFISFGDTNALINRALSKLGKKFNASRMFILSIDYDCSSVNAEYQWYANSSVPKFYNRHSFDLSSMITNIFPKNLSEGTIPPTISCKNTVDDKVFGMLRTADIVSFVCTPLYVESSLWGIIAVEDCFVPREWSEDDVSFFAMTSSIIAGAIMRNIYETKLKETIIKVTNLSKAKDEFLSKISHEIRTPMNAILGITEIQLQNEMLPQGTREGLSIIYNSGDSLLRIINDLLDLSKLEARKLEIIPVKYEIASLINDTAQLNMMRIESKPIEFKLEVDETIPFELLGDELRIKQMLNNILSNAFKYTDGGEIIMSVSAEENDDENFDVLVIFRISDTGRGMTKEQLCKIFDEYSRFNLDNNKMVEGTGLGMTITRNLASLMNGRISAESELGKGSVFTISLPQKKVGTKILGKEMAENLQKFRISSSSQIKRAKIVHEPMPYGRVLIVDDVESNLYVAKHLLDPYDLSLELATSGFEAIEKIKSGKIYDIIFMDHMMPKMDGIEAVKIIRELGYTRTIIALTANAVAGQSKIFLENGFDGFISKPVDTYRLNDHLNRLIRDKQPPEILEEARKLKNEERKTEMHKNTMLYSIFARDAKEMLPVFESTYKDIENISNNDLRLFIIKTHAMKSALANIGEISLSQIAFALENAGREGDKNTIKAQTPKLIETLKIIIKKIDMEAEVKIETAVTCDESTDYLHEQLKIISEACINYDARAANTAFEKLKEMSWTNETQALLDKIGEDLLLSDFDEANAEIAKFIGTESHLGRLSSS